MATTYTTQAAQIGLQINLNQIAGGLSFTGSTCFLLITDSNDNEVSYPCTIDTSGKFAFYVTSTGLEIPVAGTYRMQLEYRKNAELYYSEVSTVKALANLGVA